MSTVFYSHLICLVLLISNYIIVEGHDHRPRRQLPTGNNQNMPGFQARPDPYMPMNNNAPFITPNRNAQYGPPMNNAPFIATRNHAPLVSSNKNVQFMAPDNNAPYIQQNSNAALGQPNNNPAFAQPNNNVPFGQPNNNPAFVQSNNNVPFGQPNNNNPGFSQRSNNVPLGQPNNNPAFVQPNNNAPLGQPNNNPAFVQSNNNVPFVSMNNNPQFMPSNNPNMIATNERNNPKQMMNNEHLLAASQRQIDPSRSQGFYNNNNNPSFQSNPFNDQKSAGWFGTNRGNWLSSQDSELDKNKLAMAKNSPQNNPLPPRREDGGPSVLAKVAKQYAAKGEKSFNIGPFETLQGRGPACTNFENFDGFTFGRFPCPLPASTGMNQLDVFCCGPTNYQYCCNAQEFSESQRGAYGNNLYLDDQRFQKRTTYPSSTKKILAIMLPIAGVVVLAGIGALVFVFYKRFRQEQYRVRKPAGAIRLQDNYSILPQDALADRSIYDPDEHIHVNNQA